MVVMEALFFGIPVISSDEAGPSEIIKNDKHGALLAELDLNLWVRTCKDYFSRSIKRAELHEYAIRQMTWNKIAKVYLNSFSSI
jgi:glycosyltransferase involved in cell wall biosynthesis